MKHTYQLYKSTDTADWYIVENIDIYTVYYVENKDKSKSDYILFNNKLRMPVFVDKDYDKIIEFFNLKNIKK